MKNYGSSEFIFVTTGAGPAYAAHSRAILRQIPEINEKPSIIGGKL